MKLHTLYFCNRDSADWTAADRAEVYGLITTHFPGFTAFQAEGFFEGRCIPTLVVAIGSDDTDLVTKLAEKLRQHLNQQAVGLTIDGSYRRILG